MAWLPNYLINLKRMRSLLLGWESTHHCLGQKLAHCFVSEAGLCLGLGVNSLLFVAKVSSLFGPRWVQVLSGQESTHCLARSELISCRVGSQLIVWSRLANLVESEVDSSHIFSFLQGRVQGGVLEQTDLSMRFREFSWVSIRFYTHALCRFQKSHYVQSYKVIFQLFPEGFILPRCIQWVRAFSIIWELTHFHCLHQQLWFVKTKAEKIKRVREMKHLAKVKKEIIEVRKKERIFKTLLKPSKKMLHLNQNEMIITKM